MSLSDKIWESVIEGDQHLRVEDVREAVKKLKMQLLEDMTKEYVLEAIDEIFGEKLI